MQPSDDDRRDELPEHETRSEQGHGGGLTSTGISAEQRGPVDQEVVDARAEATDNDQPAIDPDEPPPAYRISSG
jgi:hypothetical protein